MHKHMNHCLSLSTSLSLSRLPGRLKERPIQISSTRVARGPLSNSLKAAADLECKLAAATAAEYGGVLGSEHSRQR